MTNLAVGGKIWTPEKAHIYPLIQMGYGLSRAVAIAGGMMLLAFLSIFCFKTHFVSQANGFDATYNKNSLLTDFYFVSSEEFSKTALAIAIMTVITIVCGIITINYRFQHIQARRRVSVLVAGALAITAVVAFTLYYSLHLPSGAPLMKGKLISSVQDWGAKNDLAISNSDAAKLVNSIWDKGEVKKVNFTPIEHIIVVDGKSIGVDVTLISKGYALFEFSQEVK